MALFGRRKPGFSKEVEMKPEEIIDYFSDEVDPAINKALDNPKLEKLQYAAKAAEVSDALGEVKLPKGIDETPAEEAKPDILDYLESLPDVEDPFPPSEPEEVVTEPQQTDAQILADYIRDRSGHALLTAKSLLLKEDENMAELLSQMAEDETCSDIRTIDGQKDSYFYADTRMTNNYAMIAVLVEEKDVPLTIARMARFNCKTYPSPTPIYYFQKHPYYLTKPQIDQAMRILEQTPDFADIKWFHTESGNVLYFYSEQHMTRKYAYALAEGVESGEGDA